MPHKQYLRCLGVRLNIFIDDQRVLGETKAKCEADNKLANDALEKAGWTISPGKSSTEAVQSLKFLGLINDSRVMKYFVPEDKASAICELIKDILKMKKVHIKVLAKLLGKLQFCFKAMGPCVKLLSRSCYHLVSKASSWNSMIILTDAAKRELEFLNSNFHNLNGFPLRPYLSQVKIDIKVSSDASDLGFCVYQVNSENQILVKDRFNESESRKSSTARELLAFHRFYCSDRALHLKGKNVIHYTDNLNCSVILSIGSRNIELQPLVMDIFLRWRELDLKVEVMHLPREDEIIQYADYESRTFDLSDFSIDFDHFLLINEKFGFFELDCFASQSNKKCLRYYSKFQEKDSEGVNFFAQSIPKVNLFVFPPVQIITPTLYHLQLHKSFGTLIVPLWMSAVFWPFLCADGRHFNHFIKDFIIFNPFYSSGPFVNSNMFKGYKKFDTLALRFSFGSHDDFSCQILRKFCIFNGCSDCC